MIFQEQRVNYSILLMEYMDLYNKNLEKFKNKFFFKKNFRFYFYFDRRILIDDDRYYFLEQLLIHLIFHLYLNNHYKIFPNDFH